MLINRVLLISYLTVNMTTSLQKLNKSFSIACRFSLKENKVPVNFDPL